MSRTQINWTFASPEIELRLRPLREHWEARGPGMLAYACKQMPWLNLPTETTVLLTEPKSGGGRLANDQIEFQGVLANPHSMLPEVVRLAWLIMWSSVDTSPKTGLGLIPLAIASAEFVELTALDETTVTVALEQWIEGETIDARVLLAWWESSQSAFGSAAEWQDCLANLPT